MLKINNSNEKNCESSCCLLAAFVSIVTHTILIQLELRDSICPKKQDSLMRHDQGKNHIIVK
jgi:hypothetical protein